MYKRHLSRLGQLLSNRVARNLYFWALNLYVAFGLNAGNEQAHHYGIIHSSWYLPVMAASLLLQCTLVYTNNLWLVPRFLARRRRLLYGCCLFLLIAIISSLTVVLCKAAKPHLNIEELQHPGFTSTGISSDWSFATIISEAETFFFSNLAWVFVFTMAWYMNDYARQRKAADAARRRQTETELQFLRSQLAPHFLFNTLNNIYALTLRESSAAPDAMLKLSAILRSLLYESGVALAPFEKEAELINAYIDLELLRLKNVERLKFEVSADGDYLVPPLLWLPVLENIFKHGTRIISDELFVEFSFVIAAGTLTILGRNYCKEAPSAESAKGIGLENLQRRLELLYPDSHTFKAAYNYLIFTTEVTVKLS